jgi:hypothetical protein
MRTIPGVGNTRPEREDARARTTYVVAARRFVAALGNYVASGVPLAPRGSNRDLPPWERAHVAAGLELQAALDDLIKTRKAYDSMRRQR